MANKLIEKICDIVREINPSPQTFNYAVKQTRKLMGLTMPKRPKILPNYLNDAEIYELIKTANQAKPMHNVLIKLLLLTGMRIAEARNLMVQDIYFNTDEIKIVQGKGSKDRMIIMSMELQTTLKLYIGTRKTGYLFQKTNGKPYTIRNLQKIVTGIIRKCNFSKSLHTHSLRHTFACMLIRKGMPIEKIQLLLGHSNIKQTQIYARLELEDLKADFLKLM